MKELLTSKITIFYALGVVSLLVSLTVSIYGICIDTGYANYGAMAMFFTYIPLNILAIFLDRFFVKKIGYKKVNYMEKVVLGFFVLVWI